MARATAFPIAGTARLAGPARAPRIRLPGTAPSHRADCAICGSGDVLSDEAHDRGLWLLGECARCGHRWTAGPFDGPTPVPAMVRPLPLAPDEGGIVAA